MRGDVSLDNNGGFVQIALDLTPEGRKLDASAWRGIEPDVFGNGEEYCIANARPAAALAILPPELHDGVKVANDPASL